MAGYRVHRTLLALTAVVVLTTAGCGAAEYHRVTVALDKVASITNEPQPALEITPPTGTADAPISTEIGTTAVDAEITGVSLVDAAGAPVSGSMRDDGTSWVPGQPLAFSQSYTATVTATGKRGESLTQTTTFTTMANPGSYRLGTTLYLHDGATYGVAMPVVVEFEWGISEQERASVQRRILVHSEPAQAGAWYWYGSRTAMYRPASFWMPGTKLTVRSALDGLPVGGHYGDQDRTATVTIGRSLLMDVDNAKKTMTVVQDGQVVKTIPVSLGKPSTPSSSGTMVVMSKARSTIFDTTRTDGANGYRVQVAYAQRLTWGGEFIHAAPWSVADQGRRNVSHGCINVSTGNAAWLFDATLIGDPVTVRGTERGLKPGNGWTAWNTPWSEFTR